MSRQNECPYLKSKDCGFPNKNPNKFCALYKHCTSYKFLKELEGKKDGKETESGSSVD